MLGQHGVEVVAHLDGPALEARRQQGGRGDQRHLGAEGGEGGHVAARHPGVLHVADDGHPAPGERAGVLADRVAVEQRLGGVLVPPVPGVDDRGVGPAGHLAGHPGGAVAHDHGVDAHGLDGLDGVAQRLALLHRGGRDREGHGVGGEALGRRLEAEPGAGGVLEEERHDGAAPQRRDLGDDPFADLDEGVGEGHDLVDPGGDVGPEVGDAEQVPTGPGRRTAPPGGTSGVVSVVVLTCASPPGRRRRRARRPPRRGGWAGSCRRSRGGWAARGAPGRP